MKFKFKIHFFTKKGYIYNCINGSCKYLFSENIAGPYIQAFYTKLNITINTSLYEMFCTQQSREPVMSPNMMPLQRKSINKRFLAE